MGLADSSRVEVPEVDYMPGLTRFLADNVHACTPCRRRVLGDSLNYSEVDITL